MDPMFGTFQWIFLVIIILSMVIRLLVIPANTGQSTRALKWQNRNMPTTRNSAMIIAKRVVHGRVLGTVNTKNYATFELPDGERLELEVIGSDFGIMKEGDAGTLVRKGTYYLDFVRSLEVGVFPALPEAVSSPDEVMPLKTAPASVISTRMDISSSPTSHYATFEFSDGYRLEFIMKRSDAKRIREGDFGTLTWQGMMFIDFQPETLR